MDETTPATPAELRAAPVSEARRLKVVDALRGVALLGILLMNIPTFSMPAYSSETYRNDPTNVNFWVSAVISIVFEGKMRALFGMVFGAGVLLFVLKKEQTGKPVTFLFYRRMFWLMVFGLIHAHVILWDGDILYLYGVCGMLVFLLRNVNPKYLVLGVPLVALLDFGGNTLLYQWVRDLRIGYVEAMKAEAEGKTLTEEQKKSVEGWHQIEKDFIPNRAGVEENTRKMKSDYATIAEFIRPRALQLETIFLPVMICDSLALMLLGLALYRWGFISGQWENRHYWRVAAIGYGLGLPLVIYQFYHRYQQAPGLEAMLKHMEATPIDWVGLIYPFQRILLVMAHISALILLYKSRFVQGLFRRLEAVGQMAFTNYITHSVVCTLFFYGYGLNYYAELQFYQLYFLVAAIWAFQLVMSPIWLQFYIYGPLEWLWRSLTYWRIQPFKRTAIAAEAT